MINNTTSDMVSQMMATVASSSSSASSGSGSTSSSSSGSSSNFEKMLQSKQSEVSSDTSAESKDTSSSDSKVDSSVENSGDDVATTETPEVTDEQMALMAAQLMNMGSYRSVEVVVAEETELDVELLVPEEEIVMVDEVVLEVSTDILEEVPVEVLETVVRSEEGTFEDGKVQLEEEVLIETAETDLEVEVEIKEVEVEAAVETVEVVEEADVVETEVKDTSSKVDDRPIEVERGQETEVETAQEEDGGDDGVYNQQSGTSLFKELDSTPVKVAETVNTRDPDMDNQIAKIIHTAVEAGDRTVTMRLMPEGLGTVTALITQTVEGALQIVLQTSDDAAATLLKSHLNSLFGSLQGTNHTSVSIEIQTTHEAEEAQQELMDEEQENAQGQENPENQDESEQDVVISDDFLQQLRLGLVKEFSLELADY